MPHPLQTGGYMDSFEGDAAMPLESSTFEPKTPFPYAGLIQMPGTDGSSENKGRAGNGADKIIVSHEVIVDEIGKGLHEKTGRPNSALLNHCVVVKAASESRQILTDFYSTVKKRKSAKQRIAIRAAKAEIVPSGMVKVQEESFGLADSVKASVDVAPEVSESPVVAQKKGGRPKGSKNKSKRGRKASAKKTT